MLGDRNLEAWGLRQQAGRRCALCARAARVQEYGGCLKLTSQPPGRAGRRWVSPLRETSELSVRSIATPEGVAWNQSFERQEVRLM